MKKAKNKSDKREETREKAGSYSCKCGFKTQSLADFRRHLTLSIKEKGKHKSLGTKPKAPVDVVPPSRKAKTTSKDGNIPRTFTDTTIKPEKPELPPEVPEVSEEETPQTTPPPLLPSQSLPPPPHITIEKGGNGYRALIPQEVMGKGIPFEVTLSVKTVAYYQIASTIDPDLTMGDFIDHCVEDTFVGRGLTLGLVKIGG